jgi:antitoxin component of MazEF toxin-antitoxin module
MRKEIKAWGNSAGIVFTKEDLKCYNAVVGDILDLTDVIIIKKDKEVKTDE